MNLDAAVAALRAGEPIVLPTDTVYGLAVDPTRPGATELMWKVTSPYCTGTTSLM